MTISGLSDGLGSSSVTIPLFFLNVNERVIPVISSAIILDCLILIMWDMGF